jgi:hypothetical protein
MSATIYGTQGKDYIRSCFALPLPLLADKPKNIPPKDAQNWEQLKLTQMIGGVHPAIVQGQIFNHLGATPAQVRGWG